MPWKECDKMDERLRFVARYLEGEKVPFKTVRSSTRGTPRGLFGSNGSIIAHSLSVRSKRPLTSISLINQGK